MKFVPHRIMQALSELKPLLPTHPEARRLASILRSNSAILFNCLDKPNHAISEAQAALEDDPKNAKAAFQMGRLASVVLSPF